MMKKQKLLFIYNPTSGKGLIRNELFDIIDEFVKSGYEVTVYPTQKANDALEKVPREAANYDRIVCCGGDGTLDEVITGMMNTNHRTPIGYIPAGSTNDFAASLNIPNQMMEAANVAANGREFPCDIGSFNDDTFVYVAAFGLFTDVSYMTNQKLKNIFGHVAYILESAKHLVDIPSYIMEVETPEELIRDEFIYGMVTNSVSVGGIKHLTGDNVRLDDGEFEVTLIRMPKGPIQLNEIVTNLLKPGDAQSEYIYAFKTNKIEFHCEDEVPWTLDGEFGGCHKDVAVKNNCQRITFVV